MSTAVTIALIIFGVTILAGLALAGWKGWKAWKAFRRFRRTVLVAMEQTNVRLVALQARTEGLGERTARLQRAQAQLQASIAEAQVLAEGASEVMALVNTVRLIAPSR